MASWGEFGAGAALLVLPKLKTVLVKCSTRAQLEYVDAMAAERGTPAPVGLFQR